MGVSPLSARAALALQGGTRLCPKPVVDDTVAKVVQAVAAELSGGTAHYEVIRDANNRVIRIRIGRVGGTLGDYLTVWKARWPGAAGGRYDGLKQR